MPIFDIQKDALCRLSETQLEELIARLAEAEVVSKGFNPADVYWSGSINSPDGGIDVRVDVPVDDFDTGFLARPNTIFQAKKQRMRASDVDKEMRPGGIRLPMLSKQAKIRGSYIIVGLAEDCSEQEKLKRLDAMHAAMKGDPNKDKIHLDFYDRSKLLQWLRQHPAVMLWVREALGQTCSGWRPYGRWSNPPAGSDDTLIRARGVSIILPTGMGEKLTIEDAINPMRELVRSTNRTIRIIGLSGVGKTRIVQSLFEESVGDDALDRTIAIYADSGAGHDPSAGAMLERLIAENRPAIMVLDNCSSSLHATLASKVTSAGSQVILITVEYDIRDDKPQSTDVVRIEAEGPALAEKLLLRRFPSIHHGDARRIAEFAGGNARVSLAVAERVNEGESLARLSDAQLFDRLFEQRNRPNESLRVHAEALSLVYSFSVASPKSRDIDELAVLGTVRNVPRDQLYGSVAELSRRDIVQERSYWRAILPHAIANRLAGDALNSIPKKTLQETFEAPGQERLLVSFAHRLGLMHDHPVAHEIVGEWLQVDSLLGELLSLDNSRARILEYVVPTAPCAILDKLETEISTPEFKGLAFDKKLRRTIPNLLRSLAYDADKFDRCVALLLRLAEFKDDINNDNLVKNIVASLFQPYISGTHASLDQRLKVIRETVHSRSKERRDLGFHMLSAALGGPRWSGSCMDNLGAQSRDFGFEPNHKEFVEWMLRFIDLTVELDCSEDQDIADFARVALAQNFQGLWEHQPIQVKLIGAAKALNNRQRWIDGWKEVREAMFSYARNKNRNEETKLHLANLNILETELAPKCLLDKIKTYVFWGEHDYWLLDDELKDGISNSYKFIELRLTAKAEELGQEFANSGQSLSLLGPDLYSTNGTPFPNAFGKGLAKGTMNVAGTWNEFVESLNGLSIRNFNASLLRGFIEMANENDRKLAQKLLDQCLDNSLLRKHLVELHPTKTFDCNDFSRCIKALDDPEANRKRYGDFLWNNAYSDLPSRCLIELVDHLLKKDDGGAIILSALSTKLLNTGPTIDPLGIERRRFGLNAATKQVMSQSKPDRTVDRYMERVIDAALAYKGNEEEKTSWIDAVFDVIDTKRGHLHGYSNAIRTTAKYMPTEFLERMISGDEETQKKRKYFITRGREDRLPLEAINTDTLIEFCKVKGNLEVWLVVADGIYPWKINKPGGSIEISEAAIKILEAAPNKKDVLTIYSRKVIPNEYSWDGGNLMRRKAAVIKRFADHSSQEIATAASSIFKRISKLIDQRIMEHKRIELKQEREQKFE